MSVVSRDRIPPTAIVIVVVCVATIARAALAQTCFGFQNGDDLEIAEQAFHRAFALAHNAWDIRSLLIPDLLVAPILKLASLLGARDPLTLITVVRAPFIALAGINALLLFALGRRWYDDRTATIGALLYAFHWMPIVYGSTSYGRTFSVTCILTGALLVARAPNVLRAAAAGGFVALAMTARFSEGILLLSILALAGERRPERSRVVAAMLGGFAVGLLLFIGLYDRITWGRWFGSLIEFVELTFVERKSSSLVARQPAYWYVAHMAHWLAPTLLPLLVVAARRTSLQRLLATVVLPLVVLSFVFHKELRYLQVIVPFALLIAARGFVLWWQEPSRRVLAAALLIASFPLGMSRIQTVTKRSGNAVNAARFIAAHHPRHVVVSQGWAMGGRIFFGNGPTIDEVGVPPDLVRVRELLARADFAALYANDLTEPIEGMLREHAFERVEVFRDRGGRAVVVFRRVASVHVR